MNSPDPLRITPFARAAATKVSDVQRAGRCSQTCGLEGCVCSRSPPSSRRAIAWRAATSWRFHSAMRAAVPSSIQPQRRSAPIGDGMIIVAQIAPVIFSSTAGGATAQPTRSPGKRLFERLVRKIVRSGMSEMSGGRSRAWNP